MTVIRKSQGMALEWRTIMANINKVLDGVAQATSSALMFACMPIFERSQHYCPVKTGALKASGYCRQMQAGRRTQAKVEIGYAEGGAPYYGFYVHEDLTKRHEGDTRAKFLQSAIDELKGDIVPRVADYLKSAASGSAPSMPDEVRGSR
jgi:hypothetical protein